MKQILLLVLIPQATGLQVATQAIPREIILPPLHHLFHVWMCLISVVTYEGQSIGPVTDYLYHSSRILLVCHGLDENWHVLLHDLLPGQFGSSEDSKYIIAIHPVALHTIAQCTRYNTISSIVLLSRCREGNAIVSTKERCTHVE